MISVENFKELLHKRIDGILINKTVNRTVLENEIADMKEADGIPENFDIYTVEKILEEFGISVNNSEVEEEEQSVQIEKPFDPEKIDIAMDRIVCISLIKRLVNGAFELESDFQRKAGLWSIEQKSRLIESILLKIPLPAFYFDSSDNDRWLVIDGLQRLSTLNEFIVKESFKLTNLEFLKQWEGLKFSELPFSLKSTIEETNFNAYLVRKATPKNVKYNIFRRINTGGLVLTPQEIRNALYQGKATKFLRKMAESKYFCDATSNSIKTDRMLDREFCLRYIAFTKLPIDSYNNSIDDFLISAMEFLNNSTDEQLDLYYEEFEQSMKIAFYIFDRYAFRKLRFDERRTPINKAIFEGWSKVISQLDNEKQEQLVGQKTLVKSKFTKKCEEDDDFIYYLKANDKFTLKKRIEAFEALVKEVWDESD